MEERRTLLDPPIETLLSYTESKFALVQLAARRARQIAGYYNGLGPEFSSVAPPQVVTSSAQPLTIAMHEIGAGKVRVQQRTPPGVFGLAQSVIEGSQVEVFFGSPEENTLDEFLEVLNGIAGLTERRLEVDWIRRGSILAHLMPYGDGKPLGEAEKISLEQVKEIEPMRAHETSLAVSYSQATSQLLIYLNTVDPPIVVLAEEYLWAKVTEDGGAVTICRQLTITEFTSHEDGTLRIDLGDIESVAQLIRTAPYWTLPAKEA
jgi:DNA-directed RNA polymerase subunit omega